MTEFLSVSDGLSTEEAALLHEKLWALLRKTSEEYTLGKSSSVSSADAQRLLASACFVLSEHLKYSGKTSRDLLSEDIFEAFEHGKKCVLKCCDETRELWKSACLSVPKIPSVSINETLKSIGDGFYCYNIDTFPSDVPCSITYPLMNAVPENELGMEYVREYLRRLMLENYILSRFDPAKVRQLLIRVSPFYRELLINLCEAPVQNAVGLAVLEKDIFGLRISAEERKELAEIFSAASDGELSALLDSGARKVSDSLGLESDGARDYLCRFAASLGPRIKVSIDNGMRGVFI